MYQIIQLILLYETVQILQVKAKSTAFYVNAIYLIKWKVSWQFCFMFPNTCTQTGLLSRKALPAEYQQKA